MSEFITAKISDFNIIYDFLSYKLSQDTAYSLTSILAWQSQYNPKFLIEDDFVLTCINDGNNTFFLSPLVKEKEKYALAISRLESFGATEIRLVTDWQAEILQQMGYQTNLCRNMSEYIYEAEKLITLSGKKYHSKRNFINTFAHKYVFREYLPSDYAALVEIMKEWHALHLDAGELYERDACWSYIPMAKKMSDYDLELLALSTALKNQEAFNIMADVLLIDNKIVGFCAGEILPSGIGAMYFEKGDINYKGIYPLIDNLFCKKHFQNVALINKQEDLGIAGLRKSKESYYPIKLAERFVATKIEV